MSQQTFGERSLALHKKNHGKVGTQLKTSIETRDDLSTVYTPGVGAVCQAIAQDPNLSFVYTERANTVAIISNGTAVLGFGNIGALAAQPVMSGKAALFKAFANLDAVPLVIDELDTAQLIHTIRQLAPNFGGINLEDIAAPQCFAVEAALQDLGIPVLHDDQHGTAVVVSAGLLNALKVSHHTKAVRVVINGAGAGGTAVGGMVIELLPAGSEVIFVDSAGVISPARPDLNAEKMSLLSWSNPRGVTGSLSDAMMGAHVFIGLSVAGALTAEHISRMSEKPIVFALANPTPEIMPDQANKAGAYVVATGRSDFPNQVNNVLAFPGLFKGALDARATCFTKGMLHAAVKALQNFMPNPTTDGILPSALDKTVAEAIAKAVAEAAITDSVIRHS